MAMMYVQLKEALMVIDGNDERNEKRKNGEN